MAKKKAQSAAAPGTETAALPPAKKRRAEKNDLGGEVREIMRSMMKFADYNPRRIDAIARRNLRNSIDDVGLVQLPVWNEATGNIVAGHQRTSILDERHHYDEETHENDYPITVVAVNWTIEKEKEKNIALNSPTLTGVFDGEKLEGLFLDPTLNLESMGFSMLAAEETLMSLGRDASVLESLLGVDEGIGREELDQIAADSEAQSMEAAAEVTANLEAEKIADIKEAKRKFAARASYQQESVFFFIAAFPTNESCAEFLRKSGLDCTKEVQWGIDMAANLGITLDSIERRKLPEES